MRKFLLPAVAAAFLATFAAGPLQAQDLGRMIADRVPLASNEHLVSTGIDDALPVAELEGVDELTPLPLPADFSFGPGYYRGEIRSYCLKAGTYGPTTGSGYLIAPLKGTHANIIAGILARSARHPEIAQEDVQRLLWAVEAGADWNRYDAGFKSRVAPLLSAGDIAMMSAKPVRDEISSRIRSGLGKLVPSRAQRVVNELNTWHGRLTSLDVPFAELERAGVLIGDPPWGAGSRREVGPGAWAYVGDGFYIRTFSRSYRSTTLEVFRTGTAEITRDELGRISRFDSGGYVIDTSYQPGDTPQVVDGRPAWRFSEVTFRHPDGRTHTIRDRGHVYLAGGAGGPLSPHMAMLAVVLGDAPKGDLGDMQHYEDGLESATDPGDFKGRGEWILEHLNRVKAAWQAAADALTGKNGDPPGAEKRALDPSRHVATPANTNRQRLGLSPVLQQY